MFITTLCLYLWKDGLNGIVKAVIDDEGPTFREIVRHMNDERGMSSVVVINAYLISGLNKYKAALSLWASER